MRLGCMETDTREHYLTPHELADVLNAMGIRPEIMAMPTFVALKSDECQVVWLPRFGWIPVAEPRRKQVR
jgi:hypothetical protein